MAAKKTKEQRLRAEARAAIARAQSGNLDGRTTQAQILKKAQQALEREPAEAIKSLLRHNLATLALAESEALRFIQEQGVMTEEGRVSDLVSKDLCNLHRCITQSAGLLAQIEGLSAARWRQNTHEATRKVKADVAGVILDIEAAGGAHADSN